MFNRNAIGVRAVWRAVVHRAFAHADGVGVKRVNSAAVR
jgi:hypothetical protein